MLPDPRVYVLWRRAIKENRLPHTRKKDSKVVVTRKYDMSQLTLINPRRRDMREDDLSIPTGTGRQKEKVGLVSKMLSRAFELP